jgi:hypothetical protein
MIFRLLAYINYLIRSKNQHGIHSPFVFDFVTKGLYQRQKNQRNLNLNSSDLAFSKAEEKLLKKILNHFQIEDEFNRIKNPTKTSGDNCKILFYNSLNNFDIDYLKPYSSVEMLIIRRIHQSKESEEKWQEIINFKSARVTMDLFYFGLVFFRKEQRKEHFIIRV